MAPKGKKAAPKAAEAPAAEAPAEAAPAAEPAPAKAKKAPAKKTTPKKPAPAKPKVRTPGGCAIFAQVDQPSTSALASALDGRRWGVQGALVAHERHEAGSVAWRALCCSFPPGVVPPLATTAPGLEVVALLLTALSACSCSSSVRRA